MYDSATFPPHYNSTVLSTMTTKETQTIERHECFSHDNQDSDWVMVNADGPLAKENFELIDAADARCWCGGSDPDRCRRQGHSWPLCNVDQGELWPKRPDEISYQSHDEEEESAGNKSPGDQSADKQRRAGNPKEAEKKPAQRRMSVPPTSQNSGPFTKLAILTDLLDPTRNDDTRNTD